MLGVEVGKPCPILGLTPEQIGQLSRRHHTSQGMGSWPPLRPKRVDLHVVGGLPGAPVDGTPGDGLFVGLPHTLADYNRPVAAQAIASALTFFPDRARIADALAAAWRDLGRPEGDPLIAARLHRVRRRVERALVQAALPQLSATTRTRFVAGAVGQVRIASVALLPGPTPEPALASGWSVGEADATPGDWLIAVPPDAQVGTPDTDGVTDPPPAMQVRVVVAGVPLTADVTMPLVVEPALSGTVEPAQALRRLGDGRPVTATLRLEALDTVAPGTIEFDGQRSIAGLRRGGFLSVPVTLPPSEVAGFRRIDATRSGQAIRSVRVARHGTAHAVGRAVSAGLSVLTVDCALPISRVGYLGAGLDRIGHWLGELGIAVETPDVSALDAGLNTLMIGVCAFGARPDLVAAAANLRRWVEGGGHLVTFYHRPWDAWNPDTLPPRPIEIGEPSLRFRVTNPTAPVTVLAPTHRLMNTPNRIGAEDWQGWHKERGLYFARRWDETYETLVSIADPGEEPHEGALLSAAIGAGRHTHVALSLHHQLDQLVPGAFRLLANLAAPA
jgi:hypothetical protein